MTISDEPTGLSRRSMLRRSAVVGGTLLWVTPTVTVLSAGPAAAGSPTPRGDGTPLRASYYILAIKCGTTKYLVKVNAPDSRHPDSFWLQYGPDVSGASDDPNDGWPKTSEPNGIAQKYRPYAAATADPPSDVAMYVIKGMLYLDLDVDQDGKKAGGEHCELLSWIGHKGGVFYKAGGLAKAYDPQVIDPDRPYLLVFPLLKNQNGNT